MMEVMANTRRVMDQCNKRINYERERSKEKVKHVRLLTVMPRLGGGLDKADISDDEEEPSGITQMLTVNCGNFSLRKDNSIIMKTSVPFEPVHSSNSFSIKKVPHFVARLNNNNNKSPSQHFESI